jgi:outer membrane protein OmpA-like peptidoglycan-associated protein
MKKALVPLAALLVSACGGGRVYHAPPPPSPYEYSQSSQLHPLPPEPGEVRRAEQPAPPRRAPQSVPSAGPLKTAMIGSYMDNQERDLRQHLRGSAVGVARPGDDIVLNIRNDALFDGNQLSAGGRDILVTVAVIARHYDHTAISIAGFTDTTGTPEQNLSASQKRARAVADALIANGVSAKRVTSQGLGEARLKIATGDHVSEPRNRRIEIRIAAQASG